MFYDTDDIDYVNGRLSGTVIRTTEDDLVLVSGVLAYKPKKFFVLGRLLEDNIEIHKDLAEFNLKSPALGFTNYDGGAYYVSRSPVRRDWKQGLRNQNMIVIKAGDNVNRFFFNNYKPLIIPVKKKYPTYSECLERVEDIYDSCAFSQYFSVDSKRKVWYKNTREVGQATDDGPKLKEDFFWLAETMQEALEGHGAKL